MKVPNQRLYRRERLRSTIAIDRLFAHRTGGRSVCTASSDTIDPAPFYVMAYPWRAVALRSIDPKVTFPRILIMVPKRRLRHAVDRVTMRRRMREAYRTLRNEVILPDTGIDIAMIYVADKLTAYDDSCKAVRKIFARINSALSQDGATTQDN